MQPYRDGCVARYLGGNGLVVEYRRLDDVLASLKYDSLLPFIRMATEILSLLSSNRNKSPRVNPLIGEPVPIRKIY